MSTATIPSSSSLARTKYANDVMEGHLRKTPFNPVMRPNGSNSIIITDKVKLGDGLKYQINFVDEMSMDGWKEGDNRVSGTGEALRFATDEIALARDRAAIQVTNITESALRTGVNLPEAAKRRLSRNAGTRIGYRLLKAICDVTQGRTRNRFLYGSDDANWNATHTTALANVDDTDDKMSLAVLDIAKYKAQNETAGRSFMRPATIEQKDGTTAEKFVVFLHPKAALQIKQDPGYKNLVNYKDKPVFNVVDGGFFIGEYNDMLIYEMPSFFVPTVANPNPMVTVGAGAAGINVVQSLLLGANAAALAYGEIKLTKEDGSDIMKTTAEADGSVRMAITTEFGDHFGDAEMAVTFTPGYKKLVDASSGTAEQAGVFSIFTSGK